MSRKSKRSRKRSGRSRCSVGKRKKKRIRRMMMSKKSSKRRRKRKDARKVGREKA